MHRLADHLTTFRAPELRRHGRLQDCWDRCKIGGDCAWCGFGQACCRIPKNRFEVLDIESRVKVFLTLSAV